MTVTCETCLHFKVGYSPSDKNICLKTGKSALWERASKLPAFSKGGDGHHIYTPVTDNCGYKGRYWEARA